MDTSSTASFPQSLINMDKPIYEKATVGTVIVVTFREHGIDKAVVLKCGHHYLSDTHKGDPADPSYMNPGGYVELAQNGKSEQPAEGAARELREELVDNKGNPILNVAPERLHLIDTNITHDKKGSPCVVIRYVLPITPQEAKAVKAHVAQLEDKEYHYTSRHHTRNYRSDRSEVCAAAILPLNELAAGKHKLLHGKESQHTFQKAERFLAGLRSSAIGQSWT